MREITADEAWKLHDCIQALAEHHNRVSVSFKGDFPSRPFEETLESFRQSLLARTSRIAVIEEDDRIIGFSKVDLWEKGGKLDYLVVLEEYRGQGYGGQLMDWAMGIFDEAGVGYIEVKVIDGNAAIHLYEKHGFKMRAHILAKLQKAAL